MKKPLLFVFVFLLACNGAFAQQDAQYSMYRFNGLYINPAYAGSHDALSATAIYRYQWVKMPGQPQTASVALHSPLKNSKIGLGLIYTYDRIGPAKTNSVNAQFAYRIPVGKRKDIKVCIGLSAGVANYRSDLSKVAVLDANDPNFEGNNQNRWLPNVGFGLHVYSDKFFVGVSLPHILVNKLDGKFSVFATDNNVAKQYFHLLANAGITVNCGPKVKFVPSVLIKYVPVHAPLTFDLNVAFLFVDRVWLGAGYRLKDSYNFMLAVNVYKGLRIGYAYDLTVSPLTQYTTGSHEAFIGYDLDFTKMKKGEKKPRREKKVEQTPTETR